MYYQKGSTLRVDENGRAESGMLIRHLVLPGHIEESIRVLEVIAEELSVGVNLSLMSQFHPAFQVRYHPVLNRPLRKDEYEIVVSAMEKMGFRNGWVQDMDSFQNYLPDFRNAHPFENTCASPQPLSRGRGANALINISFPPSPPGEGAGG
jgi:putative pyruvate formate lyase activating enzyme